jgi:predicted phage terminase large subunit-like protein
MDEEKYLGTAHTLMLEGSLYEYAVRAWETIDSVPFISNWHLHAICEHLEAVSSGQIKKLLINVPPGCSKSSICSVMWPTWEWATRPELRWFFASYDQRLSIRDSMKCRLLIESEWYRSRWASMVNFGRHDQDTKTFFHNTAGGYRLATMPGGHGTGEHPDRIVCDDPHNVRKAESDVDREMVTRWWSETMSSRGVSRDAARVVIMQRLHHKDLSGYVLSEEGGWVHICLPMRFEKGRMTMTPLGWNDPREEEGVLLTPDQFPEEKLVPLEKSLGPYGTAGQMQQRPSPREGGTLKPEWFEIVKESPVEAHRCRYWDKAGTDGGGKRTAGVRMSRSYDGIYYIEDVHKGQWSPHVRNKEMKRVSMLDAIKYGNSVHVRVEREPGSDGKFGADESVRQLSSFPVSIDVVKDSKEQRAHPLSGQAEAGNVKVVEGDWNEEFFEEARTWPRGEFKDQIDGTSGALNYLNVLSEAVLDPQYVREYSLSGDIIYPLNSKGSIIKESGFNRQSGRRFAIVVPHVDADTKLGEITEFSTVQVWSLGPHGDGRIYLIHAWKERVQWDGICSAIGQIKTLFNVKNIIIHHTDIAERLAREVGKTGGTSLSGKGMSLNEMAADLQNLWIESKVHFPCHSKGVEWRMFAESDLLAWTGADGDEPVTVVAAAHAVRHCKQAGEAWGGQAAVGSGSIASGFRGGNNPTDW